METDSDCNNNNWDIYDSDKDKEYVPEEETSDGEQLSDHSDCINISSQAETITVTSQNKSAKQTQKKLCRTRTRNPSLWACNIRKRKYDKRRRIRFITKKNCTST
ncbi:hypothetical protein QE152_g24625 [Popillia japonica]|uniref:Uncharacterized protein n=1 Tax=Popillia japonica TaxID=7064 RepID=A0AAW1K2Y8_POPJA